MQETPLCPAASGKGSAPTAPLVEHSLFVKNQGVSVILCCYNSSKRLPHTLEYLANQKVGGNFPWEIVIVDNCSTDDSAKLAQIEWKRLNSGSPLKVISEPIPGLSAARTAGIESSSYEFVIFCDDDNWLHEDYLKTVFERLSADENIGILGGRNLAALETTAPPWFDREKETYAIGEQGAETGDISERKFIFGAGMALRKSVWNSLIKAGYRSFLTDRKGNSLSSGGDSEICLWHLREGYTLFYDENLILEHFIESHRLEKAYLNKLKASMQMANTTLRVYHSILERRPEERSLGDIFNGVLYFIQGILAYPVSRKTGLRKFTKSQIAFGTKFPVRRQLHRVLSHYSKVGGHGRIHCQPSVI